MSIAVPIILAIALAVSLSGQGRWIWPNYQSEQAETSEKQDDSKDKGDEKPSEKGKSDQVGLLKSKARKADRNSSDVTSKSKRYTGSERRE